MAEYRVDVWITAAPEARKGWVEADSDDKALEAFEQAVEQAGDVFGATQDTGVYGDTEWVVTEITNVATGQVVHTGKVAGDGYVLAELSTRSFDFLAFGLTEDEAKAAMQEGWRKHAEQSGATDTWDDVEDSVNYHQLTPGQCLRDGNPLTIIPF